LKSATRLATLISLFAFVSVVTAHTPPEHARVYFVGLKDGAVVESPVRVQFGIQGFGITPAGTTGKERHTAGHHHLLINVDFLPDMDEPIPRDPHHIHFDAGETETLLELPPGKHTLQLLLGDEDHESHDPPLISERVTITIAGSATNAGR